MSHLPDNSTKKFYLQQDVDNKKQEADCTYFNLNIRHKRMPSHYHYNMLIMFAKQLVRNEKKIEDIVFEIVELENNQDSK